MQDATSLLPHTLAGQILSLLAVILGSGSIGAIIIKLLSRRQDQATQNKLEAEARHLDGGTLDRAYELIHEQNEIIHGMSERRLKDRLEIERLRVTEFKAMQMSRQMDQCQTELSLADLQMKRLKGLLDAHGIKYSEIEESEPK